MKGKSFFLFLLLICTLSCDKKDEEEESVGYTRIFPLRNKIMSLGASRVQGATPDYESFRYDLWKLLVEKNWKFNFIGTQKDESAYPLEGEVTFDPDHEGHAGYTSQDIRNELPKWLERTPVPNIVVFSSPGGNDALTEIPIEETLSNIRVIIEMLQARNPEVTIVLEEMAPPSSEFRTSEIDNYLKIIWEEIPKIASEYNTTTSLVVPIDMHTGFNDEYLVDAFHYNKAGAEFIARRHYNLLRFLLVAQIVD